MENIIPIFGKVTQKDKSMSITISKGDYSSMPNTRTKLVNRRINETFSIQNVMGSKFYCSVGYDKNDKIKEMFYTARGKSGSDMDSMLYDMGVLVSIALQNGIKLEELLDSCCKNEDGSFASPVGKALEIAKGMEN